MILHTKRWEKQRKRARIWLRDNGKCLYCSKHVAIGTMTIDHIIPKSKGGGNKMDNLTTCCEECNHAKADKNASYFMKKRYGKKSKEYITFKITIKNRW